MEQLHKILQFMPLNGVAGDVLQRTVDGAAWMPLGAVSMDIHGLNSTTPDAADELPIYDSDLQGNYKITMQDVLDMVSSPVTSVNGQTGAVVLAIPDSTSDLINDSGFVDAAGAAAAAPVQSVNGQTGAVIVSGGGAVDSVNGYTGTVILGKSDVGLGNVDNVQQYSSSNPPPYPVTSVNGQTGAVVISGSAPTLLWTNSSPLSSFASQNIQLDLTSYDFVIIEYAVDQYVGNIRTDILPIPTFPPPTGYASYAQLIGIYISGSDGKLVKRNVNVTTADISFESGTRFNAYNNGNSSDDQVCRPLRIWAF